MILRGYGVELIRLRHEDIELVREHRNSPAIQSRMEFREYITPEMQEEWFASLDATHSHYYIVVHEGRKKGLVNGAKLDWEKRETHSGGIFMWDETGGPQVPLGASLLLTDLSFILGLERTYIKVLRDNHTAINYNLQLGYELLPDQEHVNNREYVLTEAKYAAKTAKIKSLLQRLHGPRITVVFDDLHTSATQLLLEKTLAVPEEHRTHIDLVIPGNR